MRKNQAKNVVLVIGIKLFGFQIYLEIIKPIRIVKEMNC